MRKVVVESFKDSEAFFASGWCSDDDLEDMLEQLNGKLAEHGLEIVEGTTDDGGPLGGDMWCKIVPIVKETINVTKEELEQAVNTILADVVWALHANEVIRRDDGVAWLDSHTIEIGIESDALSVKIVDAKEEEKDADGS